MQHLFQSKDYHWALFIGHLVLERLLKAIIVKKTNEHAPHSHDLRRLAKLSGLEFIPEYIGWLDTITTFILMHFTIVTNKVFIENAPMNLQKVGLKR